jgi:hypothetical protein
MQAFNLEGVENAKGNPNNKKNKKFRLNVKNLFLMYFETFITRE